eukprot:scaffold34638_cov161-Amphora_coffeaeformis.AAC.2
MTRRILPILAVLLSCLLPVMAVRNLQIASPLQALTIWDTPPETPRSRFLPRFKAGLEAEVTVRQTAQEQQPAAITASGETTANWAQQAASAEQGRKTRVERAAARAFSRAFGQADAQLQSTTAETAPRSEKYQFVGVVNPLSSNTQQPITWYARPKPADSAWSVRLVHVNRRAILYDLFKRGKVDLFAKYQHQGKVVTTTEDGNSVPSRQPKIAAEYIVRERSWK